MKEETIDKMTIKRVEAWLINHEWLKFEQKNVAQAYDILWRIING